jgi:tRNA1Val (adenine37-N6)-methyltransferase
VTAAPADLTRDRFFEGALAVSQQRGGYRFSIDAVLLAHAALLHPATSALDLGTGCGIIALIMAYRNPGLSIAGIEIQPELAAIAAMNVRANKMDDRIRIACRNMTELTPADCPAGLDLIVSNPPYRRVNSGRTNPDPQRAIARHEITVTLADLSALAGRLLSPGGRFVTVYPAERLADLLGALRASRIEPKWLRTIHSTERSEAKRVLVAAVRGANPGIRIAAPLAIYSDDGSYSERVGAMLRP